LSIKAGRTTSAALPRATPSRRRRCVAAGIGYHEVVAGHTTPADLKRLVEKLVDKPAPSA
jgi:hypothetical protein